MNLMLLLIIMAEACLGCCCWLSPEALRWVAAHLLTRADVIEAARKEHTRRLQFWQLELGVDHDTSEDTTSAVSVIPSLMRR